MPALTLQPFNTLSLALNTPQQLNTPGPGHYYVQILNLGPGNLYVKGDGTVGISDVASFELPVNQTITPLVRNTIWVSADQVGKASVQLVPLQG
jgi:hypothetical protein